MKPRFSLDTRYLRSVISSTPTPLRVTHCDNEHLIHLSSAEASTLVDVCALLLLASQSAPGCRLNEPMTSLLQDLFEQFSSHSV